MIQNDHPELTQNTAEMPSAPFSAQADASADLQAAGRAIQENYFDIVMQAATLGDMLSAKIRLAQLYRSGDGVEKNSAEAIRWYSLAALQATNELNTKPALKRAETAFSVLYDLGELHYELGDSQRAISTFLRMETMLDSLPESLLCQQTDRWLQICSNKLGGLYERTAKPNDAYGHFTRALSVAERVASTDNSEITRDDLAVASYRVGFIDYLFRNETALLYRARDIWDKLHQETGNYEYRRKKCVIDTLFATSVVPVPGSNVSEDTTPAVSSEEIENEPVGSTADTLTAELAEYIKEHGYSKGSSFAHIRPVIDAAVIIILIALCIAAYFTGAFYDIFAFFRGLF